MLDGFQYVLAQVGLVVAITALLAGLLGWLIGRGNRRRTERAFEQAIAAIARPDTTSAFAPPASQASPTLDPEAVEPEPEPVREVVQPPLPHQFGTPLIDRVPLPEIDDPDATVIRPASAPKTALYVPSAPVITSAPGVPHLTRTVASAPTDDDVQRLRHELRARDLEVGRIEAGALAAWDRMVPVLEQQIDELTSENDVLRRRARQAEEHSDADAIAVERLRALVAERDARIAELRAQA